MKGQPKKGQPKKEQGRELAPFPDPVLVAGTLSSSS
jgi:hypothetical protein